MAHWAAFYERIAGFREIRYFDIKGEYTGLTSKAMTAPDGKIRIPLNEEGAGGGGQIEEYLRAYNGEGIQHIAFACDDLYAAWDKLLPATRLRIIGKLVDRVEANSVTGDVRITLLPWVGALLDEEASDAA